jgi:Asp/Glu/hydantoin racemase
MRRLALIHTALFVAELIKTKMLDTLPALDAFHMVDEGVLKELMDKREITPRIVRRLLSMATFAQETGAEFILFTCSSTSPAVDLIRPMIEVPLLKIDDPMAEKAASIGRKIGVICTAETTAGPTTNLIAQHAKRQAKEVTIEVWVEREAFENLKAGRKDLHDALVLDAAVRMAEEVDVIVLAQVSMSHLQERLEAILNIPVISSLGPCLQALSSLL